MPTQTPTAKPAVSLGSLASILWGPVMPFPHSILGHWPGGGICDPLQLPGTSSSSRLPLTPFPWACFLLFVKVTYA